MAHPCLEVLFTCSKRLLQLMAVEGDDGHRGANQGSEKHGPNNQGQVGLLRFCPFARHLGTVKSQSRMEPLQTTRNNNNNNNNNNK
mmetsp:Transcript_37726/g.68270  ORF Transcript_37726/g.68270 Transcript_37726/m.68270 type:complete len:86 (-) Transcript_37726:68-325(-)